MLSTKPTQRSSKRQKVRLMTPREAAQPCSIPVCRKPAKGETNGKFYCGEHFVAAVRKQWE